jgi:hypothetical protein
MALKTGIKMITMILLICAITSVALSSSRAGATSDNVCNTRDGATLLAKNFVRGDETFKFDGLEETLSIEQVSASGHTAGAGMMLAMALPFNDGRYTVRAKFDCRHSGYGDRTGKYLAQVITPHEAEITVVGCQVVKAILDDRWDMLGEKPIG